MAVNAFVIRPFGVKELVVPDKTQRRPNVQVGTIRKLDFERVHRELIEPALSRLHISARTTEAVVEAGNIREDMFHLLMTADLVIADVTLHNPNVYYELGIRHAFRDRFTFMIRSKGQDYPFDLKTDRYFEYDPDAPGADDAVKRLTRAVRLTLASSRVDSPVFRLLPGMRTEDRARFITVPQDFVEDVDRARKHRRGGDLRLLAAECDGFGWEVEGLRHVARAQFELNFIGGARATWERIVERYPDDVEANLALSTVYQHLSDSTRSSQALARISRQSIEDINTRAEVRALVGRNLKSDWMNDWRARASDKEVYALRSPFLRRAREAYEGAFRGNLNHTYAGLNALTLLIIEVSLAEAHPSVWKLVNKGENAETVLQAFKRQIARLTGTLEFAIEAERSRLAAENRMDFWFEILEAAFLSVTSHNPDTVEQAYLEALVAAPRYAEVSMKRSLELYRDLQVKHPNSAIDIQRNVEAALKRIRAEETRPKSGQIVMFVGLRTEPDAGFTSRRTPEETDRDEPMRFLPPNLEQRAKEEIRKALELEAAQSGHIVFGMAGGSHGSDLWFHQVCAERNIETRLYLALSRDLYVGEYVSPGGATAVEEFERLFRKRRKVQHERNKVDTFSDADNVINVMAETLELPRWLQAKTPYTVGQRSSLWMLQHALVQRYLQDAHASANEDTISASVTLFALWDRRHVDTTGGIGNLVGMAERAGIKVVHIDCSTWTQAEQQPVLQATVVPASATAVTKPAATPTPVPRAHRPPARVSKASKRFGSGRPA